MNDPARPAGTTEARREVIRQYFRSVDAGDPSVLDLFAENAQVHFPKFGIAHGRAGVIALVTTLGGYVGSIQHDVDALRFIGDGDVIAVEGAERGTMRDGTPWPDGTVSQGLFCSVYEFSGNLISRLHIYADPDFAGADAARAEALRQG